MTNKKEKALEPQSKAFIAVARELGVDEDETHFRAKLGEIARAKVPPSKRKKPKRKKI